MGAKIIAEIGVNHNGNKDLAVKMIKAAKDCGADAAKIQIFKTEELVTREAEKAQYQKNTGPNSESQFDMLKKYELTVDDIVLIKKYSEEINIELLATPFDFESLDIMEKVGFGTIKISSGDITNIPLLKKVNQIGRNVILSTGMSNLAEVEEAVSAFDDKIDLTLLHCTSNYPTEPQEVNLRAMETLKYAFQKRVGYSDHTEGIEIAIAAVVLGAEVIEKHFTLDRSLPGPDHKASLDQDAFIKMVKGIRNVEMAMGDGLKYCRVCENEVKNVARKSIVARYDIEAGETFTKENIAVKRPGTGMHPRFYELLLGKRATVNIREDQQISNNMIGGKLE